MGERRKRARAAVPPALFLWQRLFGVLDDAGLPEDVDLDLAGVFQLLLDLLGDVPGQPIIKELPMAIECELEQINEDGCVIAKIVGVSVEESFLDEKGNPDTEKISPIIFDSVQSVYRAVGQKVGNAFRDGLEMK